MTEDRSFPAMDAEEFLRHLEVEEPGAPEDAVVLSDDPSAVARTVLYLSWLRSVGLVMRALAERFPDAASWERQMADETLHEEVAAFNAVVADVRAIAVSGGRFDLRALQQAGGAHLGRALESLQMTADRLGVTTDDLLVVLVHA